MEEIPMSDLKIERHDRVVTIRLDLHILNVLNHELLAEVLDLLRPLDLDPDVGCFVVAGRQRLFERDPDVTSVAGEAAAEMAVDDCSSIWEEFARLRTPKVAAVDGCALGSGCELATMCDVIIAGESAVFGLPEIKLGAVPGIGGTQRLTRLVGRAKAMDLILTGRAMSAPEAERCGLVSRVVANGQALAEAQQLAMVIASYGGVTVDAARESVDRALKTSPGDGAPIQRRTFAPFTLDQQGRTGKVPQQRPPHFWS
jgi:enoyl-CoA hydratase